MDEELQRLRAENKLAGDRIHDIAVELGSLDSSMESIMFTIRRLRERSARAEKMPSEGSSSSLLRQIIEILDLNHLGGVITPKQILIKTEEIMIELRRLRQKETVHRRR